MLGASHCTCTCRARVFILVADIFLRWPKLSMREAVGAIWVRFALHVYVQGPCLCLCGPRPPATAVPYRLV